MSNNNVLAENLTEMVSVVFTPTQLKAVEVAAAREGRKVGNFIRHVIVRNLEVAGIFDEIEDAVEENE
jgi:hypothetical protein